MGFVMIAKPNCANANKAKAIFRSYKESFSVTLCDTPEKVKRYEDAGYPNLPVIFHKGIPIGNHEDLADYLSA